MGAIKVIVGLGNPGEQYAQTPHNLGFMAVDALAEKLDAQWKFEKRFNADLAKVLQKGTTLWLMKPHTYMNRSGESIGPFLKYYGATAADMLVLVDEVALPPGSVRIRPGGSAGGHNGMKSIIAALGTQTFTRLRLGVGRGENPQVGMIDFVLHRFSEAERKQAQETADLAAEATLYWLDHGTGETQNRYNAIPQPNE